MNSIFFNDPDFIQTSVYQEFMSKNPGKGNLKIHAYAASEALPVSGLPIEVSSMIQNKKVIFYNGFTDNSGMVPVLSLPAPSLEINNLEAPLTTVYEIAIPSTAVSYQVNMYDGICVVQNINYVPGGNNGN